MKKPLLFLTIVLAFTVLSMQLKAQDYVDSVFFETQTSKIIIDTTGGNLWQIGKPQKTFFNSAHSGQKAILTDTTGYYPPNDTSTFIYVVLSAYTHTCLTCMEFWHKYDMDTVGDKGIIEASYDGGNSWLAVKDSFGDSDNMGMYMFNWQGDYHPEDLTYTPHKIVTKGNSGGWVKSTFCWNWFFAIKKDTIIVMPDSLLIRFTFVSDSITKNKEGWMIDDIRTTAAGPGSCSSIEEKGSENTLTIFPNPFNNQTTLQTNFQMKHSNLIVYNSLGQAVKQMNNISGQSVILSRDNLPVGMYFLRLTEDNKTLAVEKMVITD
jgi:hypothetical protein